MHFNCIPIPILHCNCFFYFFSVRRLISFHHFLSTVTLHCNCSKSNSILFLSFSPLSLSCPWAKQPSLVSPTSALDRPRRVLSLSLSLYKTLVCAIADLAPCGSISPLNLALEAKLNLWWDEEQRQIYSNFLLKDWESAGQLCQPVQVRGGI